MKLTIWGAAQQVTGSMHLLELESGYKILLDCGADFAAGFASETDPIPFDAHSIDLMILSHAHLDHSGNIPLLVQRGFKGQILCTRPTEALAELLLSDYASINKTRILSNPKIKKNATLVNDLINKGMFLEKQVQEAMERFVNIAFNQKFVINNELSLTFYKAGHLLGAAMVVLEIKVDGTTKLLGFTGDVGRKNYPLLPNPDVLPQLDWLICESTYGNRQHTKNISPEEEIEKVIKETCINQAGRLIIPAFSIGRTQTLLYILNKLDIKNTFGKIKVFADSMLARQGTQVYNNYADYLNEEAKAIKKSDKNIFDFENLIEVLNFKDSKAISNYSQPCIIISSSGMITGGRIQHHIQKNINNPYCTILTIGYSAEGTPGAQLKSNSKSIRLGSRDIPIAATVINTDVFSGHADQDDLVELISKQDKDKISKIFLVHGELESMKTLQNIMLPKGYHQIEIPEKGHTYIL